MLFYLIFSFLISFFVTNYFVPLFAKTALKLGIIDYPDGKLKLQKNPTPYLGGGAIYLGFIITLALIFPFENQMFLFLIGSTLLFFIGLLDDIIQMKPYEKFIGQMIATFCFLKAGFFLKEEFFMKEINIIISFLWILTIINAFNLVDIMDGLSSLLASISTFIFLLCAIIFNNNSVAILLSAFLGCLLAFFKYNKPNASIYMGDSGSLFIGGLLATIPFLLPWSNYNNYGFLTPIFILLIPLLEISSLILIRTLKGIPFYQGSPDHFAIYLQNNGWSKSRILIYVALFGLSAGFIGIIFMMNLISLITLFFLICIQLFIWFLILYRKIKLF